MTRSQIRRRSVRAGLGAALALLLGGRASAVDQPAAIVPYRQNVMKALGNHMKALALLCGGEVSLKDQLKVHAAAVASSSALIGTLFPAGSGPDKARTGALPAVFSDAAGFHAAAARFEAEARKLDELAKGGDPRAVREQFVAAGKACTACHEAYRLKDW